MGYFWLVVSILAVNAGGLVLMFFYFRKKIQRSLELDSLVEQTRTEVGSLIAELNQTTERSISLIEDKIAKAKEVTDMAEKRIGRMKLELEKRSYEREMQERLSRLKPLVVSPPADGDTAKREPAGKIVAHPPVSLPIQPEINFGEYPAAAKTEPKAPPVEAELPSAAESAFALWRRGLSADRIAAQLGISPGEIDLILAMEEQRRLMDSTEDPASR
jgi:hypothetical protein